MKKLLTRNTGLKLLSLVFAILLWLLVMNIEDPYTTDEKVITVQTRFSETITSQNKDFEIVKGETIKVRVAGKRSVIDNLTPNDILAVADMRMRNENNSIPIEVTSNKAIDIIRWEPERLLVTLEDIVDILPQVQHQIKGVPNAPYVLGDVIIEPSNVFISGPESQINKIKSVIVSIDIDANATKDLVLNTRPLILDSNGREVEKVSMNVDTVKVIVQIDKEKTIPVRLETVGQVPEGYVLTSPIIYQPKTIKIAGREAEINAINELVLPPVDISEYTETQEFSIALNQFIPEGMRITGAVNSVNVRLEIERSITKEITVPINTIDVRYLSRNLQFRYLEDEDLTITLKGRESLLENISGSSITARLSLNMLQPGEHAVRVDLALPTGVEIIGDQPTVKIELEERLDEEVDE